MNKLLDQPHQRRQRRREPTPKSSVINRGRWSKREKNLFQEAFEKYGKEWKLIAAIIGTRTVIQIRTHAQKYFQKLAKLTGGPVMSTSKKERFPGEIHSIPNMQLRRKRMGTANSFREKLLLKKRRRENSLETWTGSEPDSDTAESDYLAQQINSLESKVSDEILAAATLLLAPKLASTIPKERLSWAKNCITQDMLYQ